MKNNLSNFLNFIGSETAGFQNSITGSNSFKNITQRDMQENHIRMENKIFNNLNDFNVDRQKTNVEPNNGAVPQKISNNYDETNEDEEVLTCLQDIRDYLRSILDILQTKN